MFQTVTGTPVPTPYTDAGLSLDNNSMLIIIGATVVIIVALLFAAGMNMKEKL